MASRDEERRILDRLSKEMSGNLDEFRQVMQEQYESTLVQVVDRLDSERIFGRISLTSSRHIRRVTKMVKTALQPVWDGQPDVPAPGDLVTVTGEGLAQIYAKKYKYWYTRVIDQDTKISGIVKGMDVAQNIDKEFLYVNARDFEPAVDIKDNDEELENTKNVLGGINESRHLRPMGLHLVLMDAVIEDESQGDGTEPIDAPGVYIPFSHDKLRIVTYNNSPRK
jgi:hypothetical protein